MTTNRTAALSSHEVRLLAFAATSAARRASWIASLESMPAAERASWISLRDDVEADRFRALSDAASFSRTLALLRSHGIDELLMAEAR